jgi:hypothetical protein
LSAKTRAWTRLCMALVFLSNISRRLKWKSNRNWQYLHWKKFIFLLNIDIDHLFVSCVSSSVVIWMCCEN